jgi:hypothetical protein
MKDTELASKYRKHAQALHAASKFDRDARRSFVLKQIAWDYDRMAQALEGPDRMEKPASPAQRA